MDAMKNNLDVNSVGGLDMQSTLGETGMATSTKTSSQNTAHKQIKLSDLILVEELGSGGFGHVDLVRFVDENFAKACKMPVKVALKRVFMGKYVTNNMKL